MMILTDVIGTHFQEQSHFPWSLCIAWLLCIANVESEKVYVCGWSLCFFSYCYSQHTLSGMWSLRSFSNFVFFFNARFVESENIDFSFHWFSAIADQIGCS